MKAKNGGGAAAAAERRTVLTRWMWLLSAFSFGLGMLFTEQ